MNTLSKPQKKSHHKPTYDYHELAEYIEAKYSCNLRNYASKTFGDGKESDSRLYLDFWHWLCGANDVSNGGYIYIPIGYWGKQPIPEDEKWVGEILAMFKAEFPDIANEKVYVEW